MPKMSPHEILKISQLEAAIAQRTAAAKALGLPGDGPEVEKILELTKQVDMLRDWLPDRLGGGTDPCGKPSHGTGAKTLSRQPKSGLLLPPALPQRRPIVRAAV